MGGCGWLGERARNEGFGRARNGCGKCVCVTHDTDDGVPRVDDGERAQAHRVEEAAHAVEWLQLVDNVWRAVEVRPQVDALPLLALVAVEFVLVKTVGAATAAGTGVPDTDDAGLVPRREDGHASTNVS